MKLNLILLLSINSFLIFSTSKLTATENLKLLEGPKTELLKTVAAEKNNLYRDHIKSIDTLEKAELDYKKDRIQREKNLGKEKTWAGIGTDFEQNAKKNKMAAKANEQQLKINEVNAKTKNLTVFKDKTPKIELLTKTAKATGNLLNRMLIPVSVLNILAQEDPVEYIADEIVKMKKASKVALLGRRREEIEKEDNFDDRIFDDRINDRILNKYKSSDILDSAKESGIEFAHSVKEIPKKVETVYNKITSKNIKKVLGRISSTAHEKARFGETEESEIPNINVEENTQNISREIEENLLGRGFAKYMTKFKESKTAQWVAGGIALASIAGITINAMNKNMNKNMKNKEKTKNK